MTATFTIIHPDVSPTPGALAVTRDAIGDGTAVLAVHGGARLVIRFLDWDDAHEGILALRAAGADYLPAGADDAGRRSRWLAAPVVSYLAIKAGAA